MEVKYGLLALADALHFSMRSCADFTSIPSKRRQAPEKTRIIYFQACLRFASAKRAVEANGDSFATVIDADK